MQERDSIIVFRDLESDSYFQALVALDYYFEYDFRTTHVKDSSQTIIRSAASKMGSYANSKEISAIYHEAIINKFIPKHMQRSEMVAFLKKPRGYTLKIMRNSKPGILGIGRLPCLLDVELAKSCIQCNGRLASHFKSCSPDSHIKVFICSQCNRTSIVQPPHAPAGHEFGPVITEGCQIVKKCKDCGHSLLVSIQHQYGEWINDSDHICRQIKVCSKCQAMEGRDFHTEKVISRALLERDWNEWLDIARNKYRKYVLCTMCGKQWDYEIIENEA